MMILGPKTMVGLMTQHVDMVAPQVLGVMC